MKPIAVVTGGAGFIGSHMVDLLLESGFAVRVIDNLVGGHRSNLEHLSGHPDLTMSWQDIRSLKAPSELFQGARYVFHFAGIGDIVPSIESPVEYMDVNVQGTVRVLECARAANVAKFVYAASSSCYGLAETPTAEDHPIDPRYPYALSKYQGEQAAFHWHKVYRLPINSVCIFNAYGPRVRTTGVYGSRRRRRTHRARGSTSEPATRSRSTVSWSCSAGAWSTFPSVQGSPIAPSPISPRSHVC
jgi:UDP-glucose 4-epimerase